MDLAHLKTVFTDAEIQTDKEKAKVVDCTGCGKRLIVNAFYAAKLAKCEACKAQSATASIGQAAIVQPGRTDPAKAQRLADCLINKEFDRELECPLCATVMELKSVSHNERYGPSQLAGEKNGFPVYRNTAGETVMYQCNECKCSLSMSTVHQSVYRRQNEPKAASAESPMTWILGARS